MDWQPVLQWIQIIQKNPVFRLFSSVRLAIPVMATLGVVVAWGTIIESRYGAPYAKLAVYEQNWFWLLIGLIWLNVLCAALSRIPYKKHHTGFVITHLGILILLAGSFVTGRWGIDGSLRIVEGNSGRVVQLPGMIVEISSEQTYRKVKIPQSLGPLESDDLESESDELGSRWKIARYIPFAKMDFGMEKADGNPSAGTAVGFVMKSPFFQVSEWLHEKERPSQRMGPALLRIVTDEANLTQAENKPKVKIKKKKVSKTKKSKAGAGNKLVVRQATDGKVIRSLTVKDFKKGPLKINGVQVSLVNAFQRATVRDNRLTEDKSGKINPAVELKITVAGKPVREVVYAAFPQFSLHPNGVGGLRFEYVTPGIEQAPEETEPALPANHVPVSQDSGGANNIVEFIVPQEGDALTLRLLKNGQEVMRKPVKLGEIVQTPWMGMTLSVGSIRRGVVPVETVEEAELVEKQPLPMGALRLVPTGSKMGKGFWLSQGESRQVEVDGKVYRLRFGSNHFQLPFTLQLKRFIKTDYPGVSMAQEYESHVKELGSDQEYKISMNEPLKKEGFTLYQSSFEQGSGRPTASIFSVNRDPGRFWKYLGSLIMSLGIITFTLHRSRVGRKQRRTTS